MWKLPVLFLVVCALGQQTFPSGSKGGKAVGLPAGQQGQGGMQQGQDMQGQGPDWRGAKLGKGGKGKGKEMEWMNDPRLMLHKLFFDHSWFHHDYIVASVFKLETASLIRTRLLKNAQDIGTNLGKFFPNVAQQVSQITKLFNDHILAADLVLKDSIAKGGQDFAKGDVKGVEGQDIQGDQGNMQQGSDVAQGQESGQVKEVKEVKQDQSGVTEVSQTSVTGQDQGQVSQTGQDQTAQAQDQTQLGKGKGQVGGQVGQGQVEAGASYAQGGQEGDLDKDIAALYSQGDKLADGLVQFLSLDQTKLKEEWRKHNELLIKLTNLFIEKKFTNYIQQLDDFNDQSQFIAEIIAMKVSGSQTSGLVQSSQTTQSTLYPPPSTPLPPASSPASGTR